MGMFDTEWRMGEARGSVSRRRVLLGGLVGAAGLAVYSGEVARHWVEVTELEVRLRGLAAGLEGMRVVQVSDIHMDEYTEPFYLRQVVERVNGLKPDVVLLTGDYVSNGPRSREFSVGAGWQCAGILNGLECKARYAVLGNHDVVVGAEEVKAALEANGTRVLVNSYLPLERGGGRIWIAGVDDPLAGDPKMEKTVPEGIRGRAEEPVILMCHAPDYVDEMVDTAAGRAVDLMLSGHTHGGQVRLPVLGALALPELGRVYVEGMFRFGEMQLYVNRGIGTVGVPFRLNCAPEITVMTLKAKA